MTPQLNAALAKAKLEFPAILANKTVKIPTKAGKEFSFTYAELEEIIEAVTPVLSLNNLCLSSRMGYLPNGRYVLTTSLRHDSGESIESSFPLPETVGDAKDLGVQISYGRRYNVLCLLELSVIEPSNKEQWEQKKRKLASELKDEIREVSNRPTHPQTQPTPQVYLPEYPQEPDRTLLNAEIDSLIKRKGITIEEAKALLFERYGARSRQQLNIEQLQEVLHLLQLVPVNSTSLIGTK
jgi:ERF superfamily